MRKKWTFLALVTAVLALGAAQGRAVDVKTLVTRTSQKALGLDFTVRAETQGDTVSVHIEVPRKDKLKELYGVRLELHSRGRRPLSVPVATRDEAGTTSIRFQIGTEHTRDCYINLVTEDAPASCAFYYSIRLRDFISSSGD